MLGFYSLLADIQTLAELCVDHDCSSLMQHY